MKNFIQEKESLSRLLGEQATVHLHKILNVDAINIYTYLTYEHIHRYTYPGEAIYYMLPRKYLCKYISIFACLDFMCISLCVHYVKYVHVSICVCIYNVFGITYH